MNKKHALKLKALSRRDFIRRAALGSAALAVTPATSLLAHPAKSDWPAKAKKYRIYMIAHAHLDVVWLWPWHEGLAVAHSTFRSVLERMKETPDLVFTSSSALYYKWVAENDPDMLTEIRQRVAEGRWNLVGGWWIEPDTNIPSGESMVRQGLYGQRTFEKLLGRRATIALTADSFGHAGTLPQIFRLQGMEGYVFMRPGGGEKDLPANLFLWEGPDGTRILAYRIHHHYGSLDQGEARTTREDILGAAAYIPEHPVPMIMKFFGVGDHGGGPSKAHIRVVNAVKEEKDAPEIFYSSIDRYFHDLQQQDLRHLPVVKDDLQHHAPGCYTADSALKRHNRLAETAVVTAEKIAATGSVFWKVNYPQTQLTDAWEKMLFLQFHDSMAGTSLISHYQYTRHGYGHALDVAEDITYLAVQKLEWQVPAEDPDAQYLLLFNPHAWEYRGLIRCEGNRGSTCFTDDRGRVLPSQWIPGQAQTHGRHTLLLQVTVPPTGYCQVKGLPCESPAEATPAVQSEERRLENEYYILTVSDRGTIGLFDKETGRQVFAGGETGCRAVVIDDPSDTWSHDIRTFDREIGAFEQADVKRLYGEGALQATLRVTTAYGRSTLTVDWSLTAGSRRIDAEVKLDWHERLKMLKFSFPVDVADPVPTCESPYGFIVRRPNGDEDPCHRWIDVTGRRDGLTCGLTVFSDAKYGYSVADNDLRLSVVRSPVYAHHNPKPLLPEIEYEWMDQGIQSFRLALVPHRGSWQENHIPRMAEEFMTPPVSIYQGIHPGTMPASGSFLEVDTPNVIVTAIKKPEEGEGLVLRLVETLGQDTEVALHFPSTGFRWQGKMRHCEIKTLRVNMETGAFHEVNLLEE
ncbi:MAG: twin-arginine translocation signal domain-containing protein [Tannerella sp.]|jgi:alpha-mannosidase|nr:twin-arginine translocation signal domain-containing protein [Tannerella sp.]